MITLTLSPDMVQIIGRALGAQPYDTVAAVVMELQKQIDKQQSDAPPVPPTPISAT